MICRDGFAHLPDGMGKWPNRNFFSNYDYDYVRIDFFCLIGRSHFLGWLSNCRTVWEIPRVCGEVGKRYKVTTCKNLSNGNTLKTGPKGVIFIVFSPQEQFVERQAHPPPLQELVLV